MTILKRALPILVLVAVVAVVVGACSGAGSDEAAAPAPSEAPIEAGEGRVEAAEAPFDDAGGEVVAEAAPPAEPAAGEDAFLTAEPSVIAELPGLGTRVIQTASLTLSVDPGEFDEVVTRARTIAAGYGGDVTSSNASQGQGEERLVRGTLVVRVPEPRYAQAMSDFAKLGRIEGLEESGIDVSQQYVDLEARERHLLAVEQQLLRFLGETKTIADALVIQDRLAAVQLQLEEVRGQLRYFDDQTSFATITLSISEHGVEPVPTADDGFGITDAWRVAADGFLAVVGAVFVGLATAGPVLAGLALAFLAVRTVVRRRRSGREVESAAR